jgi:glycosyltransferase involved in cell wall biosynthesis
MNQHQFLISPELGGAAHIGLHLARWAQQHGEWACVWVPGIGRASEVLERERLKWRCYNMSGMFTSSARQAMACVALGLKLRMASGVAHIHSPGAYRVMRPALRLTRLRTVVHVHAEPNADEMRWALRNPPDLLIPCARFMCDRIRRALGEHADRVWIAPVPNAVDTERFRPGVQRTARQKVGAAPDRPIALMLANLAPTKGQETAILTVAELKARGTLVDCWLAGVERNGEHAYERRLTALAGELGVAAQVRFLGFRDDSAELLRAADFLLLPSATEGLPLSVLEAQASKLPVLVSPVGGVPEVISDGETGFLVPADDAAGYADRMQLLLREPGLRHRLVEQAYDHIQRNHNWPTYCSRIDELYRSIRAVSQSVSRDAESSERSASAASG